MTPAEKRRRMTPSGRPPMHEWAPRPFGPMQNLAPLAPPWPAPPWSFIPDVEPTTRGPIPPRLGRGVRPRASGPPSENSMMTGQPIIMTVPQLDVSPLLGNGQFDLPWQQMFINMCRLMQPTGVNPGEYAGVTVNPYGQVVKGTSSGLTINDATLEDAALTGSPTAPTPATNDSSTAVATTAYVQNQGYATITFVTSQGYATQTFVTSQGYATETFVLSQGFATESFVTSQGYLTDAPNDTHTYARKGGAWIAIA